MVGHYLLEDIPSELINSTPPDNNRIALLPGSRPQEVERMLLPMLGAVKLLQMGNDISAVIAGVRGVYDYDEAIRVAGVKKVTVEYGQPRQVVAGSRLVVCKSGTGTLECGLIGRPTVVIYKTGWITYQIAKRVVKLNMIALVNLVLGSKVAPELIQEEASPDGIANTVESVLSSPTRYNEMLTQFRQVSDRLGGVGASRRAAEAIGAFL
jgi:lipid-A-disaccharide synthase